MGYAEIQPSTVIINCTSYGEVLNYSMTWQPQDMRDFTVIVYPNQTFNNITHLWHFNTTALVSADSQCYPFPK